MRRNIASPRRRRSPPPRRGRPRATRTATKDLPSGKRAKHMRTVRAAMTEEQRREESRKRAERRREQKRRDRAELNPEMFDAVVESV